VMPEADGLTVLRAARQKDPATLVVIMTGYASVDSAIEATREGAYDYLRKPFKLQEIDIAVANAAKLLFLRQENQKLVQKLGELTAKLENLQQSKQPEPEMHSKDITKKLRQSIPLALSDFFLNRKEQYLTDLDRLRHLYQERLLTDSEYQSLKQRLLI
jgi:DNA-binding NtrC family response regulator